MLQKFNLDKKSILLSLIIILTASASFGLGRLSIVEKYKANDEVAIITPKLQNLDMDESLFKFVASKNGTKYYPIGCKSASRIKDENKVYFLTVEEAEGANLTPSSTCAF